MPTPRAESPKQAPQDPPEPKLSLVYLAAEAMANFEALRGWGQELPRRTASGGRQVR